jgi:hypothetical protein
VAALPEELAPRAVSALRATAFRLTSNTKLIEPYSMAEDVGQTQEFFTSAEAILTEFNTRLAQIYFSHSETPGRAR